MTALVRFEAARQALAEAQRVDEVKDIRDKAEAMAAYARQAKDTELIQYATEIKVRAERRCGEMLRTAAASGQRSTGGKPSKATTVSTLTDLGLTRDESSRYQKLAAMPEKHFEAAVATAKAAAGEVTTARMLREAKKVEGESAGRKPAARRTAAKKESATSVATETASPITPDQRAPSPAVEVVDGDRLSDAELLQEMQRDLDQARATAAEFEKALLATDDKAKFSELIRRLDHAVREQHKLMADAVALKKRADFYERQLARCGKAVGQRDLDKVAPAVEAMARRKHVNATPAPATADAADDSEYI